MLRYMQLTDPDIKAAHLPWVVALFGEWACVAYLI